MDDQHEQMDPIHPWLPEHDHSPFAWSVLGAVASRVPTLELATGVTCPIARYQPVILARAAATVAALPDRPFTFALGAGERLSEHVTGAPFPAVDLRHEMLAEAFMMIRALWSGDWTTIRGQHFTVEDARVFDLPELTIQIAIAMSGPASLDLAQRCGSDAIVTNEPNAALLDGWVSRSGDRSATWTEIPLRMGDDGR